MNYFIYVCKTMHNLLALEVYAGYDAQLLPR